MKLREIQSLRQELRFPEMQLRYESLRRQLLHPNIVKLKEVIREHDELHMVFEMMEAGSDTTHTLRAFHTCTG